MYQLLWSSPRRELLTRHLPGLLISFFIAEFYFKWGSFALECIGFLATWFVIDLLYALLSGKLTSQDRN